MGLAIATERIRNGDCRGGRVRFDGQIRSPRHGLLRPKSDQGAQGPRITKWKLAKDLGISYRIVQYWEKRKSEPSRKNADRIADYLGLAREVETQDAILARITSLESAVASLTSQLKTFSASLLKTGSPRKPDARGAGEGPRANQTRRRLIDESGAEALGRSPRGGEPSPLGAGQGLRPEGRADGYGSTRRLGHIPGRCRVKRRNQSWEKQLLSGRFPFARATSSRTSGSFADALKMFSDG